MVVKYIFVKGNVYISAPKIIANGLEPNIPTIVKMTPINVPSFIQVVNTILAFLASPRDFNIVYLVAPPIAIINPTPCIKL